MKNSLKKQIIIYIAFILIAALLLMSLLIINIMENILVMQKTKNARLLISSLQTNLSYLPSKDQQEEINKLIAKYIHEESFYHLFIVNKENKIIASNNAKELGNNFTNAELTQSILNGFPVIHENDQEIFSFKREDSLAINSPLYLNNTIIGGIRGEMSLFETRKYILQMRWVTLMFIVIDAVVFIVFGIIMLNQGVIKPLNNLVAATKKLAQGDLDQQVEIKEENEIGLLSSSFNVMVVRLKEKTEELNNHIALLEKTNLELNKARMEIIRSDRLASVGKLAAGVAHEIGNPLGAIVGYINILLKRSRKNEEDFNLLQRVEKEVDRIDQIVRDLLNLAAPSKEEEEETDVNAVIQGTIELLTHQNIFNSIEINHDLFPQLPRLMINNHKLRQLLINLLLNAKDALPVGGKIFISTELIFYKDQSSLPGAEVHPKRKTDPVYIYFKREEELGEFSSIRQGDKLIKIILSDNGSGIAENEIAKIFDPFFTTKELGKGTGLGLTICHRIIEDWGGKIGVHSKPGQGTSFEILLPVKKIKRTIL